MQRRPYTSSTAPSRPIRPRPTAVACETMPGSMEIVGSTISGNEATNERGGGFVNSGDATIFSSTITANRDGPLGAIHNQNDTIELKNSIVADNTVPGSQRDIRGPVTSLGFNFVGNELHNCGERIGTLGWRLHLRR